MSTKKMMEPLEMEARLANAFQHVQPSRKLVQTVRGRIGHLSPPIVVARQLNESPRVLMVISAVISGALLLAAVARALFYIVNKSKM
jgi:hypothetical protein